MSAENKCRRNLADLNNFYSSKQPQIWQLTTKFNSSYEIYS